MQDTPDIFFIIRIIKFEILVVLISLALVCTKPNTQTRYVYGQLLRKM